MKKLMKKKGFTLVEIMIVVAIIGLLAAIGIPSFQRARANSIQKSMDNNARIVSAAADEWALENGHTQDSQALTAADLTDYIKGGAASLTVGTKSYQAFPATLGAATTLDGATLYGSDYPGYVAPQQ